MHSTGWSDRLQGSTSSLSNVETLAHKRNGRAVFLIEANAAGRRRRLAITGGRVTTPEAAARRHRRTWP